MSIKATQLVTHLCPFITYFSTGCEGRVQGREGGSMEGTEGEGGRKGHPDMLQLTPRQSSTVTEHAHNLTE